MLGSDSHGKRIHMRCFNQFLYILYFNQELLFLTDIAFHAFARNLPYLSLYMNPASVRLGILHHFLHHLNIRRKIMVRTIDHYRRIAIVNTLQAQLHMLRMIQMVNHRNLALCHERLSHRPAYTRGKYTCNHLICREHNRGIQLLCRLNNRHQIPDIRIIKGRDRISSLVCIMNHFL